jgi:hypothetical protein
MLYFSTLVRILWGQIYLLPLHIWGNWSTERSNRRLEFTLQSIAELGCDQPYWSCSFFHIHLSWLEEVRLGSTQPINDGSIMACYRHSLQSHGLRFGSLPYILKKYMALCKLLAFLYLNFFLDTTGTMIVPMSELMKGLAAPVHTDYWEKFMAFYKVGLDYQLMLIYHICLYPHAWPQALHFGATSHLLPTKYKKSFSLSLKELTTTPRLGMASLNQEGQNGLFLRDVFRSAINTCCMSESKEWLPDTPMLHM